MDTRQLSGSEQARGCGCRCGCQASASVPAVPDRPHAQHIHGITSKGRTFCMTPKVAGTKSHGGASLCQDLPHLALSVRTTTSTCGARLCVSLSVSTMPPRIPRSANRGWLHVRVSVVQHDGSSIPHTKPLLVRLPTTATVQQLCTRAAQYHSVLESSMLPETQVVRAHVPPLCMPAANKRARGCAESKQCRGG